MSSETLNTTGAFSQSKDLKNRILFTILLLIIYRLGTYVPISGIDPLALKEIMGNSQKGLLGMFNMFSGGALTKLSIFALGVQMEFDYIFFIFLILPIFHLFIFQLKNLKIKNNLNCLRIFKSNNFLGLLVFCNILIGKI